MIRHLLPLLMALLLDADENDSQTDGTGTGTTDDGQEEEVELPDLDTRIELFLLSRTGANHDDPRAALQDPDIVRGTEVFAGELLAELDDRDRQAAEAAAEVERQRLTADDEALREKIRKERADQRAQADRDARDAERRARIEAEVAAAEAAVGSPGPDPMALAQTSFDEAHAVATDMSKPIEERAAAAERGIAASAALESAPFVPDHEELAKAVEAKLKRLRGE